MGRFDVFHEMAKAVADDPKFIKEFNKIIDASLKKMGKTWEQLFEQSTNNTLTREDKISGNRDAAPEGYPAEGVFNGE